MYDSEPEARQIIDVAKGLEGIVRNSSIHAAAVVIADRPLTDIVPLQLAEDRTGGGEDGERSYRTVTQYSMKPIEEIGLLKMDFLGLRNLDVIEAALDIIEQSSRRAAGHDHAAARRREDLRDARARRLDRRVPVRVRRHARGAQEGRARPSSRTSWRSYALYRPGAMRFIDTYARNKRNPEAIHVRRRAPAPDHGVDLRGVILYQEQSMQIAKEIAGFSGPEADDLRKAIGKKQRDRMAALKDRFFEGARASGTRGGDRGAVGGERGRGRLLVQPLPRRLLRADLLPHRWLKANYPAEYMAALISSVMSTKDKVPFFVAQCEDMGIEVLPPDVNKSGHDFKVVEGNIRFGLDAVKGLGYRPSRRSSRAREEDGPFTSIWDFCRRVDCRGRQQEGDRVARQVRRVRLAAGHPHRA